ncbi:hypothetical protein LBMAG14_04410 [Actinomycetes bacterium]|nr:hypothetical protein LBMAG14_04410 [Actinomycetes bacterium]
MREVKILKLVWLRRRSERVEAVTIFGVSESSTGVAGPGVGTGERKGRVESADELTPTVGTGC